MCNRAELEGLIVIGVEEVRRLEVVLKRQWAAIASGPSRGSARKSFLRSLAKFEEQASQIEKLLDVLEQEAYRVGPLAA